MGFVLFEDSKRTNVPEDAQFIRAQTGQSNVEVWVVKMAPQSNRSDNTVSPQPHQCNWPCISSTAYPPHSSISQTQTRPTFKLYRSSMVLNSGSYIISLSSLSDKIWNLSHRTHCLGQLHSNFRFITCLHSLCVMERRKCLSRPSLDACRHWGLLVMQLQTPVVLCSWECSVFRLTRSEEHTSELQSR